VLVTRVISVLGKAGKTGSLYKSLKAISDQVSTRVIVVRVAEAETGEGKPTQSQLIIGGTQADGSYTGMFAFLTAEQKTGYRPRILGIPEYDTAEVTAQLRVIAKQLRAFSYSYCDGCDTIAEAKTYRETFAEREGMLIWPNFIAYNPLTGVNEEFPPWLMRWVCGRLSTTSRAGINHCLTCRSKTCWGLRRMCSGRCRRRTPTPTS
jgi:phage tail sheath protein FI